MAQRVRLLREAGGLGDVLRTFPVAAGIKREYEGGKVWYYTLPEYCELAAHCPDVDVVQPVGWDERRPRDAKPDPAKFPYLARGPEFDHTIDLYCPAFLHEKATDGRVTKDRIELFCEAAGVQPESMVPKYEVRPDELAWAEGWLEGKGLAPGHPVAVAPFATHALRSWPVDNWRRLLFELSDAGWPLLVFDTRCGRITTLPGIKLVGIDLWKLAALLARCQLFLSVDTGPYHLAAAVGTPAIGLFGPTEGRVISRWYPDHIPIQGKSDDCDSPCYLRQARGWSRSRCYVAGCRAMNSITTDDLLEGVADGCRNATSIRASA